MHPLAVIVLYPLLLAHELFNRYAVVAWGMLLISLMMLACTPSWSEEAAYLPAEWPVALAISGLLMSAPMTWSFWRWYCKNHEAHGPVPGNDVFNDDPIDIRTFLLLLATFFVIATGMLIIGRLHM